MHLQVEFDVAMTVRKIKTKGREDYPQWVTSYTVQISQNGDTWNTYMEPFPDTKVTFIICARAEIGNVGKKKIGQMNVEK